MNNAMKWSWNPERYPVWAWVLVFCAFVAAQASAQAVPPRTAVVEVTLSDPEDVTRLQGAGVNVSRVRPGWAEAYVSPSQLAHLVALDLPYRVVAWQPAPLPKGLEDYHDYDEVTARLTGYAEAYPTVARLISVGQTPGGRELWVLHLSDNPDLEEDEPEFKYIATMHGDEPVGTELCLNLIDRLLLDYGVDERTTRLVDETSIWIMPLMNPDGRMAGTRSNQSGRDLNRSFPIFERDYVGTQFDGETLLDGGRAVEAGHVMRWSSARNFVLSANFHTGATVVNYPYDFAPGIGSGRDAPTPDDDLMRVLALRYASENGPMYSSTQFPQGITNGSAWFSVANGMQDWNYRYLGCIEMTIELFDTKWPDDSLLPALWADNKEAMLAYLEGVHLGLRGVVADRATGEPLWAQVRPLGNPQRVFTDPEVGDYHRLLLPGEYDVEVFAPGYIPYLLRAVTVGDGAAVRRDVALSTGDLNGDGWVEAVDVQLAIAAVLQEPGAVDADVDGGGVSVTDIQHIINIALGRSPSPRPTVVP